MNIVGITTCVGPIYAKLLARTLPVWMETLDFLVVATDFGASTWLANCGYAHRPNIHAIDTNAFTRNNAHFNKAAALNEGIAAAKPSDWILSFDCDILPPWDWREQAERFARKGCLNGVSRYKPSGKRELGQFYPYGYFQLWHTSSPHNQPFDDSDHAGGYDRTFMHRWPQEMWNDLRFRVTHLGEPTKYWFGERTTAGQMERAKREASAARKAHV